MFYDTLLSFMLKFSKKVICSQDFSKFLNLMQLGQLPPLAENSIATVNVFCPDACLHVSMRAGERAEGLQPAAFLQDLHDGQAATEHRRAEGHDGVLY